MRRAHLDATQSSSSPWVSKDRFLAGPNGRLHPRPTGYSDTTHRKVRNSVLLGPPDLTQSRTFVLRFTLVLQLVLRREPRPARSGLRQASFPCPHQPARADYSPSCQADMAAIRPPLTVSGASQASLRHPPASFGIRTRCFLAAAAPSASRYGSRRSPLNCASPGLPCLYAPARSVVTVTPGEKLTQYWCTKRLE